MTKRIVLLAGCLMAAGALVSCSDDTPTEPGNTAPVIVTLAADPAAMEIGATASVTCTAADDDGDVLTYTWTSTAGTIAGASTAVTWTAPLTVGAQAITCVVGDGEETVSESVDVTVFETVVPGAMATVQGGTFDMGDSYGDDPSFGTWDAVVCNWSADGYRLPTEAEW